MGFREKNSFDVRSREAAQIREKFPGRYPIIVEKAIKTDIPDLDKCKFLVPGDLTMGQFIYVIRKRLSLPPEKALFVFVGNTLVTTGTLIRQIFTEFVEDDGFTYVQYAGESTFG